MTFVPRRCDECGEIPALRALDVKDVEGDPTIPHGLHETWYTMWLCDSCFAERESK